MRSANQLTLDVPGLFPLDNRRWILSTASASSFWMDRSVLRTQSYQRRGGLSPFLFLERISPEARRPPLGVRDWLPLAEPCAAVHLAAAPSPGADDDWPARGAAGEFDHRGDGPGQ